MVYKVKSKIKPKKLVGISKKQIDEHWKLYEGYVNQSNSLLRELKSLMLKNEGSSLLYSDRRRRLGFEISGMVLHELYFENLKSESKLKKSFKFYKTIEKQFGSFDKWKEDFINTAKTRSIGWAICYLNPENGVIFNHFIQLHEEGNITGFIPLLVVDVWEHAYMVDHLAGGRLDYIKNVFENINWDIVENRYLNM